MSPEQSRGCVTKGPPDNGSQTPTPSSELRDLKASYLSICLMFFFFSPSKNQVLSLDQEELQGMAGILTEQRSATDEDSSGCTKIAVTQHPVSSFAIRIMGYLLSNKHCLFSIHIFSIWITNRTLHQELWGDSWCTPRSTLFPGGQGMFSALDPKILPSSSQSQLLYCDTLDSKA